MCASAPARAGAPGKMRRMAKPSPQMQTLARALQGSGGEAPLARKLGVSVETLSAWLRGEEPLPAGMYLRARELGGVRRG
jgi:hypothetical protein